jgi:hypothetical protein
MQPGERTGCIRVDTKLYHFFTFSLPNFVFPGKPTGNESGTAAQQSRAVTPRIEAKPAEVKLHTSAGKCVVQRLTQ